MSRPDASSVAVAGALTSRYLDHADLSTVHRYTHVGGVELHAAAAAIAAQAGLNGS